MRKHFKTLALTGLMMSAVLAIGAFLAPIANAQVSGGGCTTCLTTGAQTISGQKVFTSTETIKQVPNANTGLQFWASGTQGGIVDGKWILGAPYTAGVSLQAISLKYQDGSTPNHIVTSQESSGTFAEIGQGEQRSRYEAYDRDGEQNPSLRLGTYPSATLELGRIDTLCVAGGVSRSGSTVTVNCSHHFGVGDVLSLTTGDPLFAQGLNLYTVTSVADVNHFTYTNPGTAGVSTVPTLFTTETDFKLRSVEKNHGQIVIGAYNAESIAIDFYADSMVTSAGYGASYGGSILYQPTFVNHAASPYALVAGSTFLVDASAGAVEFDLADTTTYFGKPGRHICVKKTDSSGNAVTLTRSGSADTIDGSTTKALASQFKFACVDSDGAGHWFVLGSN